MSELQKNKQYYCRYTKVALIIIAEIAMKNAIIRSYRRAALISGFILR